MINTSFHRISAHYLRNKAPVINQSHLTYCRYSTNAVKQLIKTLPFNPQEYTLKHRIAQLSTSKLLSIGLPTSSTKTTQATASPFSSSPHLYHQPFPSLLKWDTDEIAHLIDRYDPCYQSTLATSSKVRNELNQVVLEYIDKELLNSFQMVSRILKKSAPQSHQLIAATRMLHLLQGTSNQINTALNSNTVEYTVPQTGILVTSFDGDFHHQLQALHHTLHALLIGVPVTVFIKEGIDSPIPSELRHLNLYLNEADLGSFLKLVQVRDQDTTLIQIKLSHLPTSWAFESTITPSFGFRGERYWTPSEKTLKTLSKHPKSFGVKALDHCFRLSKVERGYLNTLQLGLSKTISPKVLKLANNTYGAMGYALKHPYETKKVLYISQQTTKISSADIAAYLLLILDTNLKHQVSEVWLTKEMKHYRGAIKQFAKKCNLDLTVIQTDRLSYHDQNKIIHVEPAHHFPQRPELKCAPEELISRIAVPVDLTPIHNPTEPNAFATFPWLQYEPRLKE